MRTLPQHLAARKERLSKLTNILSFFVPFPPKSEIHFTVPQPNSSTPWRGIGRFQHLFPNPAQPNRHVCLKSLWHIGFKIKILGRLEGGRRTRRTLTTDNASKIFILKPIEGNVIYVKVLDMQDGTPVLDIKPYIEDKYSCPSFEGKQRPTTP